MNTHNFTTTFSVAQTPEEAFAAINDVRGWWSGSIEGDTDKLGDEFTYRYGDVQYSKQKLTDLIPGRKVVWQVLEAHLKFTEDPSEWTGTEITFEVSRQDNRTEVRFAHLGLTPEFECFEVCSSAWGSLINGNLRKLIATGKPQPDVFVTSG
jgi:hypothetical protein